MSVNGISPYYDGGTFRLYVYDGSFHKDKKESWFGKLTLRIGDHWIFAGDSSADSKLGALKALMRIHRNFVLAMKPYETLYHSTGTSQDPIDAFLQELEDGKERKRKST